MALPGSVSSGSVVSLTGPAVDNGLLGTRSRPIVEIADGQFSIDVAPQGSTTGLPDVDYLYVGDALNHFDGKTYPVFYEAKSDKYYIPGIDNIKYYLYGYSAYSNLGNGVFSTSYTNYSVLNVDASTKLFNYGASEESPACFCLGTLILTAAGEYPVEELAIGDLVATVDGRLRPIRWVGRRSYAGRFLAANPGVQPICVRAGSLGDDLPRRNLLVSPNHGMFMDGVLVPARHLVNGSTVTREHGLDRVDYFHIELDSHDVVLAEGAPSESFVDDDSRGMFHNVAEWERMYAGPVRGPAVFCAPRVESGPELEAIRRRMAESREPAALVA